MKDEGNPLIAKEGDLEAEVGVGAPNEGASPRGRSALAALAVIVTIAGAAGLFKKSQVSAAAQELTTVGYKKEASDILIYKRTCPSTNPAEDCMWLAANLGIDCEYAEMTLNGNDPKHDDWCGARAEAMAGNFNVHHIKVLKGGRGDLEACDDEALCTRRTKLAPPPHLLSGHV